jgi:hypothetical protein
MMGKQEVLDWINTLDDGSGIAIDEGGLSLVEIDANGDETDAYLEVGMTPSEEDQLDGRAGEGDEGGSGARAGSE